MPINQDGWQDDIDKFFFSFFSAQFVEQSDITIQNRYDKTISNWFYISFLFDSHIIDQENGFVYFFTQNDDNGYNEYDTNNYPEFTTV